jgi:hypothetical protein
MDGQFLINTPTHKRWWLPDGRHQYESMILGDLECIRVIDMRTMTVRVRTDLRTSDPNWESLSGIAQDLARKRYRGQIRHKSREVRVTHTGEK